MVRGGIKVTTASVASDGSLTIVCSRGVKLLADAPLVEVADGDYDIIVLPGGMKGAECFRDSPLLVETVRQFHLSGRIVAAICAAPEPCWCRTTFSIGNMTGFPALKDASRKSSGWTNASSGIRASTCSPARGREPRLILP
jgi:4-methyl-5(b-hydroxyethyl)-thiazole monophosphate biosynthesis